MDNKAYFLPPWRFLKKYLTLLPVDFNKPWWRLITRQRFYLIATLIGETIVNAFRPLSIVLLGGCFAIGRFDYFVYLFIAWTTIYIIEYAARVNNYILKVRALHSLRFRAHQWFLQVDPIYHAHRSSGTVLGKIERAYRGFEKLIEAVSYEIIETVIGVITVIATLCFYNIWLGVISFFFLSLIVICNLLIIQHIIVPQEKRFLKADDKARSANVESLLQINLIRTGFATNQINSRLEEKNARVIRRDGKLSFTFIFFYTLIKISYLGSLFVLGLYVMNAIKGNVFSIATGTSLILAYMRGTYRIVKIERPLRHSFKSIVRIQDLFNFLNDFGKQSYPVLSKVPDYRGAEFPLRKDKISVVGENLFFDYSEHAKIFDGHSLHLAVPQEQENKLYGIIGPSGIGKSSFLLLLGGQLKPASGIVLLDDIDIYEVDDVMRQKMIALQGQVSSQMRGTLRHNLLFSLPRKKPAYTDDYLIDVLKKVGLWSFFKVKKGLDTFVGEGGFTLSGGQRQRLNFANLFLRATYYKPLLILIDEPTSSLDVISEQAITEMIHVLAKDAVTFVIAHRIKTLSDAVKIMDFSLLEIEKEITFYSDEQLKKRSEYYRRLISGDELISQ